MNDIIHTEKVGRFTINVFSDYDDGMNANEWGYMGAKLYADNRNFYVGLERGETLRDIINTSPEGTRFYFVDWRQYSSASNPVLRSIGEGKTRLELAKEYAKDLKNEVKELMKEYNLDKDDAVMELWAIDEPDLESDIMIAVIPLTAHASAEDIKKNGMAYYGFSSQLENAHQTLEDWKSYLDGAYGFSIVDDEGQTLEIVGGYYGLGNEYYEKNGRMKAIEDTSMMTEARAMAKALEKTAKKQDEEILKEAKKGSVTMNTTLADMMTSDNDQVKRLAKGIYKEITK